MKNDEKLVVTKTHHHHVQGRQASNDSHLRHGFQLGRIHLRQVASGCHDFRWNMPPLHSKNYVIAADHPKYTGTLVKHMNLSLDEFATSWNCHMPYVKICSRIIVASTLSFRYVCREKLNKILLPQNWMILRTGMQPAKNTAHPITPRVDPHFTV